MAPIGSLLLLSSPPSSSSYAVLNAAYGAGLTSCFEQLRSQSVTDPSLPATLDVVLPCRDRIGPYGQPRSHAFQDVQRLLATVYRLICIISAKEDIPTTGAGSINARILLLDHCDPTDAENQTAEPSDRTLLGPVIALPTLASSWRKWPRIFALDDDEGKKSLNRYLSLCHRVPGFAAAQQSVQWVGAGSSTATRMALPSVIKHETQFGSHVTIAVGGTFDHLHAGHKLLLTMTVFLAEPSVDQGVQRRIIVGITGDELLKNKKHANYLGSWDERQREVEDFVRLVLNPAPQPESPSSRPEPLKDESGGRKVCVRFGHAMVLECVEISDPFGPTITDESITALVVSGETRSGGQAINTRRKQKGWSEVEVFEVDVLDAQEDEEKKDAESVERSFAGKISSTEIRRQMSEQDIKTL
ncbi:MAG: hypothetical protein M1817_000153 [Caeruleum heppii]|nr:MAG: hypothetical protein M1817_000153 [Caeruleum heppii]